MFTRSNCPRYVIFGITLPFRISMKLCQPFLTGLGLRGKNHNINAHNFSDDPLLVALYLFFSTFQIVTQLGWADRNSPVNQHLVCKLVHFIRTRRLQERRKRNFLFKVSVNKMVTSAANSLEWGF